MVRNSGDEPVAQSPNYYLWFDTEFTTLDLDRAHLLQVALVVTDIRLRRVVPPERDLVLDVRLPEGATVSAWSKEHMAPLLQRSRGPHALPVSQVEQQLAAYVRESTGPVPDAIEDRPVLAGNSIHADWWLARKYLPRFAAQLHYRHLDVSSWKVEWEGFQGGETFDKTNVALIRRYFPEAGAALSNRPHDAYYDVIASIAELAYYRAHFRKRNNGEGD